MAVGALSAAEGGVNIRLIKRFLGVGMAAVTQDVEFGRQELLLSTAVRRMTIGAGAVGESSVFDLIVRAAGDLGMTA